VKKLTPITGAARIRFLDTIPEIKRISLRRLIDGGAAILALTRRNHHIDMIGRLIKIPFVRLMFRVWVCS
jgi:hypothetical protein